MTNGAVVQRQEKESFWRRMVRGQPGSGLSIRAYCVKHGVKEPAYYWWRVRLARRDAAKPRAAFVPVRVIAEGPAPAEGGHLEILLPGGRQVQVRGRVNKQALADVLAVLATVEARPC